MKVSVYHVRGTEKYPDAVDVAILNKTLRVQWKDPNRRDGLIHTTWYSLYNVISWETDVTASA